MSFGEDIQTHITYHFFVTEFISSMIMATAEAQFVECFPGLHEAVGSAPAHRN